MAQEIERKFLVKDDSYRQLADSKSRIKQGYICSARGRTVRVRIRDKEGFLTIKGPSDESGLSRYEWERQIPLHEAEELMKLCEPGLIDKTRYLVNFDNHTFEVDEFYGENDGLVVAEVELSNRGRNILISCFSWRRSNRAGEILQFFSDERTILYMEKITVCFF